MIELHHADCLHHMRTMPEGSVDAIVSDPPYGISFMGKDWDHGVPGVHFWEEALRVAKPGTHLLAFGGTRTFHRLAVAIEDAGWEIRDTLMWVYGSGFPKNHDVSKGIDREAGAEREVIGTVSAILGRPQTDKWTKRNRLADGSPIVGGNPNGRLKEVTAPATEAAKQWQGWGTALKPAWEPIIMARKPLAGTVAKNVQEYGTGAINVDGCRVGTDGGTSRSGQSAYPKTTDGKEDRSGSWARTGHEIVEINSGRWPANVIHDGSEEVVGVFPAEAGSNSGQVHGSDGKVRRSGLFGNGVSDANAYPVYDNSRGSAARFFKSCKPDEQWHQSECSDPHVSDAENRAASCGTPIAHAHARTKNSDSKSEASPAIPACTGSSSECSQLLSHADAERQENIDTTQTTPSHLKSYGCAPHAIGENINQASLGINTKSGQSRLIYTPKASKDDRNEGTATGNNHPTVKPTALMRYLCKLITPPNGTVFDPFMGSGSTGKAAVMEGFSFIGCDIKMEHVDIARARIEHAQKKRGNELGLFANAPAA